MLHLDATMNDSVKNSLFNVLSQNLSQKGWHCVDHFVPADLCESLLKTLLEKKSTASMKPAHIGKGSQKKQRTEIRGDFTVWLDDSEASDKDFFIWVSQFMKALNQRLFINLCEAELHYAFYPPETFYKKHLDVFNDTSSRKVSLVLYLNRDWKSTDGGELILYKEDQPEEEMVRILPEFGRLVVFASDALYHQVNFTKRERFSVTGWLKNRV